MLHIDAADISARLRADNPWWSGGFDAERPPYNMARRAYYAPLKRLVTTPVKRAVILLGARRVGKTTLLQQLIAEAVVGRGLGPVLFASIDTPTYTGISLAKFLNLFEQEMPHDPRAPRLVIFDEIQYLKGWENHLKDLVDRFPATRFICSGSASAALKRKSDESGAGRFTDFNLPPLTFAEFIRFTGQEEQLIEQVINDKRQNDVHARDLISLNNAFVDYLNYGGYPEVVANPSIRSDFQQFVGRDIVQKVLMHDLPSLYGIQDIQELNRLFTAIAYNTGQEISLDELSRNASVAKNTIMRYLEYLEAAFLIIIVRRVDEKSQQFKRQVNFKVYLTNPSMRAALFGPIDSKSSSFGALAETATFAQWLHTPELPNLHYARWAKGEVDVVRLNPATGKPLWAYDVKWSDRPATNPNELTSLAEFAEKSGVPHLGVSTITLSKRVTSKGHRIKCFPLAHHCYRLGWLNVTEDRLNERLEFSQDD